MPDFEHLDFYQLLGVDRTASPDEIRRAYRREISKYHPDRFVHATPAEQVYAERRSQRITEAYGVLTSGTRRGSTPVVPSSPAQPRDYPAELYEQAQEHLHAGRTLQAIGVLRQLQQINPFYRDSADLLAEAETRTRVRPSSRRRGLVVPVIGTMVGMTVVALALWAFAGRDTTTSVGNLPALSLTAPAITAAPAPTGVPTLAPTVVPTTAPTTVPTDVPTAQPTAVPTIGLPPTAVAVAAPELEGGTVLLVDTFDVQNWATMSDRGWAVGYDDSRYRIGVDAGVGAIWSFQTGAAQNTSVGVDVQVASGEGGLLLSFRDAQNYLSFTINPQQTSYRLEQRQGGLTNILAGGQSEAIIPGSEVPNRIVVRLGAGQITLIANGQVLAEVETPDLLISSRYGMLAFAGDTSAEVWFDNLEIRALE